MTDGYSAVVANTDVHAFRVRVEHRDGDVVIELAGHLGADEAPTLRDAIWPLLGRYESDMVSFDCSRLLGMDLAGLAVLVRFARAITPGRTNLRSLRPELGQLVADSGYIQLFDQDRIVLR